MQVKSSGCQTGVRCKAKLAHNAQTAPQRTPNQSKDERTNRQHIGKSLGTGVADVVGKKIDAHDGLIDLQNKTGHKKNAVWSTVTGVKHRETRKIKAQTAPQ